MGTFCFFQKKSEWIGLKENHPKAFEHAKSLEKTADKLVKAFLENKIIAPIPSRFTEASLVKEMNA